MIEIAENIEDRVTKIEDRAKEKLDSYTISINLFQDCDSHITAQRNIDSYDKEIIHEGSDKVLHQNDLSEENRQILTEKRYKCKECTMSLVLFAGKVTVFGKRLK